jgi:ATP/maltotriose-dependent transcriptional regulator MalT
VTLYEAIGDVETLRGRYGEALGAYERGAALASPGDVARFEARLGSLHLRRGAPDLADLHLAAALARLPGGPSALRARVLGDQSLVAVRRGDEPAAARLARASRREAKAAGDREAEAQAENLLAMLARRNDDVAAARRHLRRSLDLAGRGDEPGARVAALNNLALLERAVGNLDDALGLTDEALRRCTVLGDRHREAALRNNRADLLHELGRRRESAEELKRSVIAFAAVGDEEGPQPGIWRLVDW